MTGASVFKLLRGRNEAMLTPLPGHRVLRVKGLECRITTWCLCQLRLAASGAVLRILAWTVGLMICGSPRS